MDSGVGVAPATTSPEAGPADADAMRFCEMRVPPLNASNAPMVSCAIIDLMPRAAKMFMTSQVFRSFLSRPPAPMIAFAYEIMCASASSSLNHLFFELSQKRLKRPMVGKGRF